MKGRLTQRQAFSKVRKCSNHDNSELQMFIGYGSEVGVSESLWEVSVGDGFQVINILEEEAAVAIFTP